MRIAVVGTPEDVAACAESYTGQFLREVMARRAGATRGAGANGGRNGGKRREAAE